VLGDTTPNILFYADHHRIGAYQMFYLRFAKSGSFHPAAAVGAGVIESRRCFDQHVQTHQQAKDVLASFVVDNSFIDDHASASTMRASASHRRPTRIHPTRRSAASMSKTETSAAHWMYRLFCLPSSPFLPPSFPFWLASAVLLLSWTFDAVLHWPPRSVDLAACESS
jgi:hypothetical protein